MNIKRIDTYDDHRFRDVVLKQHGCFDVDGLLYEVEIISDYEAIIRGEPTYYKEVMEEFRFYSEHITKFYNSHRECIKEYPSVPIFDIQLKDIQPSQFLVDKDKKEAVGTFINEGKDIIVPVIKMDERYISLDGHTRLSLAVDRGYTSVRGYLSDGGNWAFRFVEEAIKRSVKTPYDLKEVNHEVYNVEWNQFCDAIFAKED